MKQPIYLLSGLFLCILLFSCSNWHYKHQRVDTGKKELTSPEWVKVEPLMPASFGPVMDQQIFSTPSTMLVNLDQTKPVVKIHTGQHRNSIQKNILLPRKFIQSRSDQKRLLHTKEIDKASLSGWLKIMIILFAVGLILIIFVGARVVGMIVSPALGVINGILLQF